MLQAVQHKWQKALMSNRLQLGRKKTVLSECKKAGKYNCYEKWQTTHILYLTVGVVEENVLIPHTSSAEPMQESCKKVWAYSANNVFGWTVFKQLSSAHICFCTRQFHGPKFVFDCAALYCLATGCKCNSASRGSSRPVIYKWIQHDPATQCCKQSKGEVNGIKPSQGSTPQQWQQEVSPLAKPPGHAGKAFPHFLLPIPHLAKAWDHDRGDEVRPRALVLAQYMPVALFGLRSNTTRYNADTTCINTYQRVSTWHFCASGSSCFQTLCI